MGVITYQYEIATAIPPAKMFKAIILDSDSLMPKIVPNAFKSVEYIEGNGELHPGSIKKITFGEGNQLDYIKEKIETLDKVNFVYGYSVIEGNVLMGKLEKISHEAKFEPCPPGGSICKVTSKYYTVGDFEITEEEATKAGKGKALEVLKAVEGYLLTNPEA